MAMRKLWEDHITWTRLFIVNALGGPPDKAATTDRLPKNRRISETPSSRTHEDAAGDKQDPWTDTV